MIAKAKFSVILIHPSYKCDEAKTTNCLRGYLKNLMKDLIEEKNQHHTQVAILYNAL